MHETKLHPALDINLQISMLNNGLIPAHAYHMHKTDLLNELPPIDTRLYLGSPFQLHIETSYAYRMFDLCGMLYSTYLTANAQFEQLDTKIEAFKKRLPESTSGLTEAEHHDLEISTSRAREAIYSFDLHLKEIGNFASQGFVVQLWAFNEKYLSQLLQIFGKETGISFTIPYRWDKVTETLNDLNINLSTLTTASSSYNELRILNNKIKHLGEVDATLSTYAAFNGKEGVSIDDISLDLQRYLDCSYAVLTFLAEQLSQRATDTTLKSQLLSNPRYQIASS